MSKILLQAKDVLGAPRVNPYDSGRQQQYTIQPSAAVFHMHSADMELFAKSERAPLTVILARKPTEPDFSEQDILGIAG